jgi:hypothetical protein
MRLAGLGVPWDDTGSEQPMQDLDLQRPLSDTVGVSKRCRDSCCIVALTSFFSSQHFMDTYLIWSYLMALGLLRAEYESEC